MRRAPAALICGGGEGNIAYSLQLLGDRAIPMAPSGSNFASYAVTEGVRVGIVASDGREGMIQDAAALAAAKIPFIFDPGQTLLLFDKEELQRFLKQATWIALNEYEWATMQRSTRWTIADVLDQVHALIVTLGDEGSLIHTHQGTLRIPCARPRAVIDLEGCGDAYRAGLLHGLMHRLDWVTTGEIATLMAAIKIESHGPRNHRFTPGRFRRRFKENFGSLEAARRAY